ncbi:MULTISPECIES: putative quinol monooxygenase [Kitasatospora]|uniref:Antibiotic biosynthesis monooxygenase n=1 Tax=Kitasatospora cathayae TaxID=3004092 RepID=A0ABY7Q8R8_9ACTN|nr:antibiotic biosynthesis monooxygenase family protein [Kitasatospora sp. HUAS 3-15]WBP89075.1 antibiotic biosynthesis monooxygenase [Kitasatospora sp. HUAS 3-15]
MPIVIATIKTKPGRREEVLAAFEKHSPEVHAEPGCELYAVHAGPDRVTVVEKWTDQASLDAHSAGASLAAIAAAIGDTLAEPLDVAVMQPFPAGDAAKGLI